MKDPTIFDAILDYAGAARCLEGLLSFLRDEIIKIKDADGAELDEETRRLNKEIDERAHKVFVVADNIFQARNKSLDKAIFDLAYAMGPEEGMPVHDEDEVLPTPEEAAILSKLDVAALLGIDVDSLLDDDDENDKSNEAESDEAEAEAA